MMYLTGAPFWYCLLLAVVVWLVLAGADQEQDGLSPTDRAHNDWLDRMERKNPGQAERERLARIERLNTPRRTRT